MRKVVIRVARSWREVQAKRRMARFQEQRKKEIARRAAAAGGGGERSAPGVEGEPSSSQAGGSGATATSDGERNERGEDRLAGLCVVCIDRPAAVVFTNCGHMCCCEACGVSLNRCPICRIRGGQIKVFKP